MSRPRDNEASALPGNKRRALAVAASVLILLVTSGDSSRAQSDWEMLGELRPPKSAVLRWVAKGLDSPLTDIAKLHLADASATMTDKSGKKIGDRVGYAFSVAKVVTAFAEQGGEAAGKKLLDEVRSKIWDMYRDGLVQGRTARGAVSVFEGLINFTFDLAVVRPFVAGTYGKEYTFYLEYMHQHPDAPYTQVVREHSDKFVYLAGKFLHDDYGDAKSNIRTQLGLSSDRPIGFNPWNADPIQQKINQAVLTRLADELYKEWRYVRAIEEAEIAAFRRSLGPAPIEQVEREIEKETERLKGLRKEIEELKKAFDEMKRRMKADTFTVRKEEYTPAPPSSGGNAFERWAREEATREWFKSNSQADQSERDTWIRGRMIGLQNENNLSWDQCPKPGERVQQPRKEWRPGQRIYMQTAREEAERKRSEEIQAEARRRADANRRFQEWLGQLTRQAEEAGKGPATLRRIGHTVVALQNPLRSALSAADEATHGRRNFRVEGGEMTVDVLFPGEAYKNCKKGVDEQLANDTPLRKKLKGERGAYDWYIEERCGKTWERASHLCFALRPASDEDDDVAVRNQLLAPLIERYKAALRSLATNRTGMLAGKIVEWSGIAEWVAGHPFPGGLVTVDNFTATPGPELSLSVLGTTSAASKPNDSVNAVQEAAALIMTNDVDDRSFTEGLKERLAKSSRVSWEEADSLRDFLVRTAEEAEKKSAIAEKAAESLEEASLLLPKAYEFVRRLDDLEGSFFSSPFGDLSITDGTGRVIYSTKTKGGEDVGSGEPGTSSTQLLFGQTRLGEPEKRSGSLIATFPNVLTVGDRVNGFTSQLRSWASVQAVPGYDGNIAVSMLEKSASEEASAIVDGIIGETKKLVEDAVRDYPELHRRAVARAALATASLRLAAIAQAARDAAAAIEESAPPSDADIGAVADLLRSAYEGKNDAVFTRAVSPEFRSQVAGLRDFGDLATTLRMAFESRAIRWTGWRRETGKFERPTATNTTYRFVVPVEWAVEYESAGKSERKGRSELVFEIGGAFTRLISVKGDPIFVPIPAASPLAEASRSDPGAAALAVAEARLLAEALRRAYESASHTSFMDRVDARFSSPQSLVRSRQRLADALLYDAMNLRNVRFSQWTENSVTEQNGAVRYEVRWTRRANIGNSLEEWIVADRTTLLIFRRDASNTLMLASMEGDEMFGLSDPLRGTTTLDEGTRISTTGTKTALTEAAPVTISTGGSSTSSTTTSSSSGSASIDRNSTTGFDFEAGSTALSGAGADLFYAFGGGISRFSDGGNVILDLGACAAVTTDAVTTAGYGNNIVITAGNCFAVKTGANNYGKVRVRDAFVTGDASITFDWVFPVSTQ